MEHIGTQPLETRRLRLRRFTLEDAELMYQNWASDPNVTKFLTWPPHASVEVSREIVETWLAAYERPDHYHWAIVLKGLDQPIGSIGAVRQSDEIEMVHIGYCIGTAWWHQGMMTEALMEVMRFFFEDVKVNRIESRHSNLNPNSGAVMRKCGMKYEGTKRQGDCCTHGISDSVEYAILAEDYFPGFQLG